MDKAPDAFRTISEVAEELQTPAHVLRFWESRFPQIKPVKRAGGRRYYRPADVALLTGIRQLLHTEGMTIRGVQKVLREQGVRHVASLSGADVDAFDLETEEALDDPAQTTAPTRDAPLMGQVVPIDSLPRRPSEGRPAVPDFLQDVFSSAHPTAIREPARFAQGVDPTPPAGESLGVHAGSDADPDPAELPLTGPREGDGGFLAFPSSRRARPKPVDVEDAPAQARLPFDIEVPEAPHVWVEDDGDSEATLHNLPSTSEAEEALHAERPVPGKGPFDGILSAEFGSAPVESHPAATPDTEPPAPEEGLLAGILAEEFGSALIDEVSKAIAAAMGSAPENDPSETGLTEAPKTETGLDRIERSDPEPTTPDPTYHGLDATGLSQTTLVAPLVPDLTGLATRLRARSGVLAPDTRFALEELHSRLGLLHAQMAEAVRLRR